MLEFHKLTLEDKQHFPTTSRYLAYNYYYSFARLWEDVIDLSLCKTERALYLKIGETNRFFMPITENLPLAMEELEEYCYKTKMPLVLEGVTSDEANFLKESGYTIKRNRDFDDYIYTSEKLINLKGRKLQSKRNHISRFEREYTYSIRTMNNPEIRKECYKMASTTWLAHQEDVTKEMTEELSALKKALDCWDELNFIGMIICIDHNLTAFTIGEIIDENMAIIHFEKGDTSYQGVYSVINQLFCSQYLSDVKYVNRQEDAGVAGLRKAKLSYKPDLMVEKYKVVQ